jgi:hypothetical protein
MKSNSSDNINKSTNSPIPKQDTPPLVNPNETDENDEILLAFSSNSPSQATLHATQS